MFARKHITALASAATFAALVVAPADAWAHPHAWVKSKLGVVYENGTIVALRHTWIFDAYYTEGATEGLDKNGDGQLDRAELAELAQVNMDGLKEFDFFTDARLAGQPIRFGEARDGVMEMVVVAAADAPQNGLAAADEGPAATDGPAATQGQAAGAPTAGPAEAGAAKRGAAASKLLSLSFVLPLKQAILAEAKGVEITVRDPSIFIWFEPAKRSPVQLVNAPEGCGFKLGQAALTEEQKRLDNAFGGGAGRGTGLSQLTMPATTVKLSCP